jgi:YD repeat-containing protein
MRPRAGNTRSPGWKTPLWWLAALILLLVLSLALTGAQSLAAGRAPGAGVQGSRGAGEQGSASAPLLLRTSAQNRTVSYTYDAAGRLIQADYGEGASIAYTYDAAGNLVQHTTAGGNYPGYLPMIMR